jgi:hypothetical protein
MWPITFEERLQQWHALRVSVTELSGHNRYLAVNDWWFRAPMINHYLHWDDFPNWPDPWHLLDKNSWCDLARALGIVYTLMMVDNSYQDRLSIVQYNNDNLVLVDNGKYILNWCPRELLNIDSEHFKKSQRLACDKLYFLIN